MIDVIVPAYNCEQYIEQRIETIFNQCYDNMYVIILDDNSSDNTSIVLSKMKRELPFFFEANNFNSGSPFFQWNKGIKLAKNDFIWIAECDDYSSDNFLQSVIEIFKKNPQVGVVYTQSARVNAKGEEFGTWLDWTSDLDGGNIFENDFVLSGKEFIRRFLLQKNVIPNASAVVFRKEIYELIGGADESIRYCSDWLTWLKMLTKCDIGFVAQPLNYFRFHEKSVIATAKGHMLENDIPMRLKYHAFLKNAKEQDLLIASAKMLERDYLNLGIHYYYHRDKWYGIVYMLRSVIYAENKIAAFYQRSKYIIGLLLKWVPNR